MMQGTAVDVVAKSDVEAETFEIGRNRNDHRRSGARLVGVDDGEGRGS